MARFNAMRFDIFYYIIAFLLFLNVIFEFCFKYSFRTEIGLLYFGISSIFACLYFINIKKKLYDYLNCNLSYLLPTIIIISCLSKLYLIPFIGVCFVDIIFSKKNNISKRVVIALNSILFILLLIFLYFIFFSPLGSLGKTTIEEIQFSSDGKYAAAFENSDLGATGGDTKVYVGRNISLGVLGYYCPRNLKYYGQWGENPEVVFEGGHSVRINGKTLDINDSEYSDEY